MIIFDPQQTNQAMEAGLFFLNQTYSCVAILRAYKSMHELLGCKECYPGFPLMKQTKEIEKDDANQHFRTR